MNAARGGESKARRAGRAGRAASSPAPPRPAWWLPGPHLPTIFGRVFRRVGPAPTTRERWDTPDGDSLSVERLRGRPDAPRLVVFHGLEGGTHSTYARGLLHGAHARGWWADLVLWRTCDGTPVNRVRRSYHSGASDDVEFAIENIVRADPGRPVLVHGVSLGGNALLKWLGERGERTPPSLRAAAAVSVPFDLAAASKRIDSGFSRVYSRFFLKTLKAKTAAKLAGFPDLVDAAALSRVRTLWEFDDLVTGPVHGFADAADYYARASSLQFLDRIRIPTLLLNAQNDPFLPRSVLDRVAAVARENPFVHCQFPNHGGHAGFIAGSSPAHTDYWMERFTMDWLESYIQ